MSRPLRCADRIPVVTAALGGGVSNAIFGVTRIFGVIPAVELLPELKRTHATKAAPPMAHSSGRNPPGSPEVDWSDIRAMGDRMVHGYFDIDADIVFQTAQTKVPSVLASLRGMLG